jgi:hypothetical protein
VPAFNSLQHIKLTNSYHQLQPIHMSPTLLRSATGKAGTVSVRALLRSAAKPAVKPVQAKTASKTVSSRIPIAAPKPQQLQLGFTKVSNRHHWLGLGVRAVDQTLKSTYGQSTCSMQLLQMGGAD